MYVSLWYCASGIIEAGMARSDDSGDGQLFQRLPIIVTSALVVIAICVISFLVWRMFIGDDHASDVAVETSVAIDNSANTMSQIDTETDAGQIKITGNYQQAFDRYYDQVSTTDPTEWTVDDVSKAQFCLIYADKIGLYQQAQLMLGMLSAAKDSGVISDDQMIVSDEQINAIQQRIIDSGFAEPSE